MTMKPHLALAPAPPPDLVELDDADLIVRALGRDELAMRTIIRRHNQRLFRVARAVTGNDTEAEDVVQEAFVNAFAGLGDFRGEARFSTWLTRIALNAALMRKRRRWKLVDLRDLDAAIADQPGGTDGLSGIVVPPSPEAELGRNEVRAMLEHAIDRLPPDFRVVFVLRDVEGLGAADTALHLDIPEATVRTRLFRARRLLRKSLESRFSSAFAALFPFDGARCSQSTERLMMRLTHPGG